ncbi:MULTISPECIES: DUF1214 domain-containing protein [unclassified Mycobacterium]|uniref:DUF1214 domain-containing protein n=1 Tax=unclassified Mycobacterium TaxID=2642494 RepID=UPI00096E69BD|nr:MULTISPECIES: DUF1214 domain-containing protein [unclassified Mycobacterium]OMC15729.1 hypothetical protein A5736_01080 [Mycobacterium sp. SP-6446]OMC56617.1 hypothetical protein A5747_07545 [Mycobacterium sp. IS-836]
MTEQPNDVLRAAWRRFGELHDDLLDVALAQGDLDEGSASALLGHLIGHIQYMGLQLRSDPARPTLINAQYAPWNWGHSNPDTLYLSARIDDAHDYRVYGTLGSVAQTTFGVYAGKDDQARAVKTQSEDLQIGPDGSFEIYFSRRKMGDTNWFELPPGAESFCCYQTYGDWQRQAKGDIRIECLDAPPPAHPPSLAQSVAEFDEHLAGSRDLFTMWVKDIPARVFGALPKNFAIPPMQPPSAMAGAWFVPISWELQDRQALVIDYQIPSGSPYVGICLTNRWSEMIDIETRQTSLNLAQSHADGDRVRVLVSNEDVGVDNWLDARGYRSGVVTWRATAPEQPATPTATVIDINDIDGYFGRSRRVTAGQRAAALSARQRHFAERNAL